VTLSQIIFVLRSHPAGVALVTLLSMLAGVLGGHKLVGFPPHLQGRVLDTGIASKQIMLDKPETVLTNYHTDAGPLVVRTGAIGQLMVSRSVLDAIAHRMAIPSSAITAEGPWNGPPSIYNVVTPSEARANQVLAESTPYRLTFMTRTGLPVITVFAQAPSPAEAAVLADVAFPALRSYLEKMHADNDAPATHPLVIRDMGPATPGSVGGGAHKAVPVLAAVATFILGLMALLSVAALRARMRDASGAVGTAA